MREYEQSKGMDALLFDCDNSANNFDSTSDVPQPPGFIGYPQAPLAPNYVPFNYPVCIYNNNCFNLFLFN